MGVICKTNTTKGAILLKQKGQQNYKGWQKYFP